MKNVKPYAKYTLWLGLLYGLVCTAYIVIDGLQDDIQQAQTAVVLGSKVGRDGLPSAAISLKVEVYLRAFFFVIWKRATSDRMNLLAQLFEFPVLNARLFSLNSFSPLDCH